MVVILADDFGNDSLGCYGSKVYEDATPQIDKLAADGARFDRCYATGICSPSRAQLASVQYPLRNGTLDIDGSGSRRKNDPT